jgi:hypothetical protein
MVSIYSSGNAGAPGTVRAMKAVARVELSGKILTNGKFSPAQIIMRASVEALDEITFPGDAQCSVGGLSSTRSDPFRYNLGGKFRPIVETEVLWRVALETGGSSIAPSGAPWDDARSAH